GDKDDARRTAYLRPFDIEELFRLLIETTAHHLASQVKAGADCVQIFESWSQDLPEPMFERLIIKPTAQLVRHVRALGINVPIIGFSRGSGAQLGRYARETGVTALGVDYQTPAGFAREQAPAGMPLQGNLDPQLLVAGGDVLEQGVRDVLATFK